MAEIRIDFVRLPAVPLGAVTRLLNEPRNARHMPLAAGGFTEESAAEWVEAKDGQWERNGYGPWAVLVDGQFAGWGGFQQEQNGADFALVLAPEHWGHGAEITRLALDRGFGELGLDAVIIALPYTRSPDRVVARFGFAPDGEVTYGGAAFRQYRLTRQAWSARTAGTIQPLNTARTAQTPE
nr:GNAT family protein [uncultured Friedmanniella sp.]